MRKRKDITHEKNRKYRHIYNTVRARRRNKKERKRNRMRREKNFSTNKKIGPIEMMLRYGVMCGEIFSSAKFVTYDSKKHGLRTFSFWRGKRKKVEPSVLFACELSY
ncbi:hypothetical protein HQ42_08550 [Porphyromonas gulae]|nr:hypothetical protein HQ42_08550 [Porphyromonas gulae]